MRAQARLCAPHMCVFVRVRVCVCARACDCACVRACVRACLLCPMPDVLQRASLQEQARVCLPSVHDGIVYIVVCSRLARKHGSQQSLSLL